MKVLVVRFPADADLSDFGKGDAVIVTKTGATSPGGVLASAPIDWEDPTVPAHTHPATASVEIGGPE